ncbi:MAG: S9 family peptidase [Candidatus Korobacteraceae bacterium]|jgi:dipeptidyl aminopeptidase/acylaminoacyl peptidase
MLRRLLIACILLVSFAAVAQKRPFTFEDMMNLKRVGDFTLSPDGRWVAFSAIEVSLAENSKQSHLWIIPLAGGAPHRLTEPGLGTEDRLRFSPDGKQVLFTAVRNGVSQIFVQLFHPETGTLLAAPRQATFLSTEADGAIWSPDGKQILFVSTVWPQCHDDACNKARDDAAEKSKVKAKIFTHLLYRHWSAYQTGKRSHLFLISTACNSPEACIPRDLTPGDHDVPPFSLGGPDEYQFSPDGREIAYTSNLDEVEATSTNSDVFTLSLVDPEAKPKNLTAANLGADSTPLYSPDGKYLAIRSQFRAGYESDRFRLRLIERATGNIVNLTENFDRWVDSVVWSPDSSRLYFTAEDAGDSPVYSIDVHGGQPRELVRGYNSSPTPTADGRALVLARSSVRFPTELFVVSTAAVNPPPPPAAPSTAKRHRRPPPASAPRAAYTEKDDALAVPSVLARQLTHVNDELLAQIQMQPIEWFWFTGSEKKQVQGFILKPPGFDPSKKYPVKFLIHGGPQGAWGDDWSYRWNPNLFAASGYVVVMINPRGSTGYGQQFIDDVNGDWGGRPFDDLMLGLTFAEQKYDFIDKERECALGASYGGYMANWILGHTDRFKCIVSHDGMFNTESAYGTTEELWFNEWEFNGTPWTNRALYRRWSPALAAPNFKTPTLVIHGQLDYRLDVSEGFQLFTTLQRLKIPSRMLYFPDEGHWVLKPQNSQLWWKTVTDWVDWYIGVPGKHPYDAPPTPE